ncbi:hypothetical protein HYPSUDRAFT_119030, partial [Hypholoma sublateritium FD-334 SS-4]
ITSSPSCCTYLCQIQMPNHPCPALCGRFFITIGGLNSHLSASKSCRWYIPEMLHELDAALEMEDGPQAEAEDFLDYDPQHDPEGADLPDFQELLDEFVVEKLGLSYHNIRALHQKIDSMPERAGEWQTKTLRFEDCPDETFTIHHRDPIEAIKTLWRDPDLSPQMTFRPKKVYSNSSRRNRIYNEMWTGQWWHVLQSKLPQGGTLAPVIIATDKTQLTQFSGGKAAYPVYLTIGNIPKATRRKPSKHACILIAYLSVDKVNRTKMTDQEHRSRVQRIFHESMRTVLEPLIDAGKGGIEMTSSNGAVRNIFPILTSYVADYPEQCLVTCTKYGTCVKCKVKASDLANATAAPKRTQLWTESVIQDAKADSGGNRGQFHKYCMSFDVAGSVYRPFWEGFPLVDIHQTITPDVLHQLYQGVFKHLVSWCQRLL